MVGPHLRGLGSLLPNPPEQPTPSSSKLRRLVAVNLWLPIGRLGPAKKSFDPFELFRHERPPAFDYQDCEASLRPSARECAQACRTVDSG